MSKRCGIEFPHFGASYQDAVCIDGYLYDMDSWDGSSYFIGGDEPCPVCNTDEWLKLVLENGQFETKEEALNYVEQLKTKYLHEKS